MDKTRMMVWYALAFSCFLVSYPTIFYAKYLHRVKKYAQRDWFADIVISRISRVIFYMTGSRVKVIGQENVPEDRAVIFVSNHQGHMDSVIIQGFIKKPKGFVSIKAYENFPIVGSWMTYMGSVFLDKDDTRQTLVNINQAVENLNRGQSMVVFPEGKLSDGEQTLDFERGWLRLVTKSNVPIVPVTIKNSYKILSYNGRAMHPALVECIISKPIEAFDLKRRDEQAFLVNLRETIVSQI